MSSSNKDLGSSKKRDPRSGTRKVSSLSAEQLERKRANDREAQRSIRQRNKEHIEQLEGQVATLQSQIADLRTRSERFEELIRRNTALDEENNHLKHQLAAITGGSGFAAGGETGPFRTGWRMEDTPSTAAPSITSTGPMLSPHFSGTSHPTPAGRTSSRLSTSSRSSHPHEWQQMAHTRSPSLCDSSDAEFSGRLDPYVIEGQLPHQGSRMVPPSMPAPSAQMSFSNTASANQQSSETSFSHHYPVGEHLQRRRANDLHPPDQTHPQYLHQARSMSVPNVTQTPQIAPATTYQQPGPTYQHPMAQPPQREQHQYGYHWVPQG
ncbi:hypothetical protein N7474_004860 [Penicillium riverlandense]|uniref:uncharacterized protein n=1 Tax=Penicillium riverlandense TaxID=1903569 RepID=UPI002546DC73|nr:uncharacterized protein N7474_004860 [Penicillium riverlandense]KAJ5819269.1 hypothetical protein N7474_004860 [Penicillium riverlandense]